MVDIKLSPKELILTLEKRLACEKKLRFISTNYDPNNVLAVVSNEIKIRVSGDTFDKSTIKLKTNMSRIIGYYQQNNIPYNPMFGREY